MEYRMTFLRRLNHIVWIWFLLVLLFLISILLGNDLEGFIVVFLILSPFWVPAIVTHILYVREELNKSVEFSDDKLIVIKRQKVNHIPYDEIEKVHLFIHGGNTGKVPIFLTPLDTYYFFRVTLRSGEKLQFTCLLMDNYRDFEKYFKSSQLVRRRGYGMLFYFSVI